MSQRDLGQRMKARGWKWTHVTVGLVEKGERPLRLAEAQDIAAVLDADLEQLLLDSSTADVEMHLASVAGAFDTMRRGLASFMFEQSELALMRPNIVDERLAKAADGWIATRPEDNVLSVRRELGLDQPVRDDGGLLFADGAHADIAHLPTLEEVPDGKHHTTTER